MNKVNVPSENKIKIYLTDVVHILQKNYHLYTLYVRFKKKLLFVNYVCDNRQIKAKL